MDYLSQLLKTDNSELARHLRHDLYGLCASLKSALQQAGSDPGAEVCNKLIEQLNQLLQEAIPDRSELSFKDNFGLLNTYNSTAVGSSIPGVADRRDELAAESIDTPFSIEQNHPIIQQRPIPHDSEALILKSLLDYFVTNETLLTRIGDLKLKNTTDSVLWTEIQLLLLRLSERVAIGLREKSEELAKQAGVKLDLEKVVELPFDKDELCYAGLSGTVNVQGLRLSCKAPLDKRVAHGKLDNQDLNFLAQVVSIYLFFIERDPSLQHCLKSVYRFGITPLRSKQQSGYIKTLLSRFQRVQESEDDPVASLKARLDLDEAIHSLVYLPPVEEDSWWGKLQEAARKTLEPAVKRVRNNGHDVGIQWLLGAYENVNQYTQDDVPLKIGGTPGKVLVCLRIYAWIDEEKILGRVIFCPK